MNDAAASLLSALAARGMTLAGAESCTGGLVSAAITSVPGSSKVFKGAVVAYADDVKLGVLGVDASTLAKRGAVSEETAVAMALGAARILGADCAYATTGVAGPDGGTPDKPVGRVCFGYALPGRAETETLDFPGSREAVRSAAVGHAMATLAALVERSSARVAAGASELDNLRPGGVSLAQ